MTALDTLDEMAALLAQCQRQACTVHALTARWRSLAGTLALPARYGVVLGDVLDRLEASALFSEESCSFSQRDLLQSLQTWADKARAASLSAGLPENS